MDAKTAIAQLTQAGLGNQGVLNLKDADPATLEAARSFGELKKDANGDPYIDGSMLPKRSDGTQVGQVDSDGHFLDNTFRPDSDMIKKGIVNIKDSNDIWQDPLYGNTTHSGNIDINEKKNKADQHTMLDTIGPAAVMAMTGLGAFDPEMGVFLGGGNSGLTSAASQAIGTMGTGSFDPKQMAINAGSSYAGGLAGDALSGTIGGTAGDIAGGAAKNVTSGVTNSMLKGDGIGDPTKLLESAAMGAVGNVVSSEAGALLPPESMKALGYVRTAYGWYRVAKSALNGDISPAMQAAINAAKP